MEFKPFKKLELVELTNNSANGVKMNKIIESNIKIIANNIKNYMEKEFTGIWNNQYIVKTLKKRRKYFTN